MPKKSHKKKKPPPKSVVDAVQPPQTQIELPPESDFQKIAKEWGSYQYDLGNFIQNLCKLKDQRLGRPIPFIMWPCQIKQLEVWILNKRNISLKSRQIGISWLSAAVVLWRMLFNRYFEVMILSKKEDDASKYLDKVKFMYYNMPKWVHAIHPILNDTKLKFELIDSDTGKPGSCCMAESSNPEAGRSETLNMLIFDEAAFIPDAASIWTAAEPTLEKTDGTFIAISTANGYDKFFQPKWAGGIRETNGFATNFIGWDGDPVRTQEWYDKRERIAKAEGRIREFHQEYPRTAEEAFMISGQTFFDPDMISELITSKHPEGVKGELYYERNQFSRKMDVRFRKHAGCKLVVFEKPVPGRQYVCGIDTAEGNTHGDLSLCPVYDRRTKEQVAEYAGVVSTNEFGKIVEKIGYYYNEAILNIEMNSIGESLLNYIVKQRHYPSVFRQMRYDERSKKKIKKLGWRTTATTKRIPLDAMACALKEHEMIPHSRLLFSEMKTFVILETDRGTWKYKASGNNHDDAVIAHSLCAIVFQEAPARKPRKHKINPDQKNRFKRGLKKGSGDLERRLWK